jgi:hypothetical protein
MRFGEGGEGGGGGAFVGGEGAGDGAAGGVAIAGDGADGEGGDGSSAHAYVVEVAKTSTAAALARAAPFMTVAARPR